MWSNQQYFVTEGDENKRVINSNEAVSAAIEKWRAQNMPKPDPDEIAKTEDEDGFTEGIARFQRETVDYEAMAKEEAKNIIIEAKAEADRILEKAHSDAEADKQQVYSKAHEEGYHKGYAEGEAKASELIGFETAKLEQHKQQLESMYEKKHEDMEAELVEVILRVFESVFNIQFSDKKDMLMYLIGNTLRNIDNAKDFRIKVSDKSQEFVKERMSELKAAVGSDVVLELVTDASLEPNACIIETENGIFDCSLGVQLDNLIRDIKTLSLRNL